MSFFACRVLSGILCDVGTFALMVKVLNINDIIAKIVTQIMVVILNYVLSKLVIFKKKSEKQKAFRRYNEKDIYSNTNV